MDHKSIYPDRIHTLETISGLKVTHRKERGDSVFEFWLKKQPIKQCFTYPKAKLFAEGIQLGKQLIVTDLSTKIFAEDYGNP